MNHNNHELDVTPFGSKAECAEWIATSVNAEDRPFWRSYFAIVEMPGPEPTLGTTPIPGAGEKPWLETWTGAAMA